MATSNNNIITTDSLKPVEPLQTVTPTPDTTNYGGIVSGVYDSILNEYNTLNANVKAGEKVQADTGSDILSIMNELTGKTGATQTAQETAGVNKAREEQNKYAEQLANLNAQASVLNREAQAIPLQVQEQFKNTGATDRGVAPIETGKLRENAIRALSIAQQSDIASAALTGSTLRLKSAEEKAQQIIDLKYKPLEETLALKEKQYLLNKDILDKYDKKRAEALSLQIEKEKTALADKKEEEKSINKMIIDATPNAPANVIAVAKEIANKGGKAIDVATALGQYGGDYLGDKLKRLQITKAGEEINKLRAEIKATTSPISTTNIPNTSTGFVQKLLLTAKNDKNLDTSERQQLSKMGMVISQLGALQSNLNKNNKTGVIKGRVNKLLGDLNLDKDITTINAQIQALIPNVARGIYGEVGVLTDADIANYKKTVANLTNSKDQNDAVLALTLKNALKSYENTLNTASNSGINVSGWAEDYLKINNQVKTIEDRIGVSKQAVNDLIIKDKNLAPVVKELYQNGLTDGEILDALNAR